ELLQVGAGDDDVVQQVGDVHERSFMRVGPRGRRGSASDGQPGGPAAPLSASTISPPSSPAAQALALIGGLRDPPRPPNVPVRREVFLREGPRQTSAVVGGASREIKRCDMTMRARLRAAVTATAPRCNDTATLGIDHDIVLTSTWLP